MPDEAPGMQPLRLRDDFPPVPTEDWEAAIRADLKGADYDKKLVWGKEESLSVRPYYRRENLAGLDAQTQAVPGAMPYVRGSGSKWEILETVPASPEAVRADAYHEAGATPVQELGYALAAGVERLEALSAARGSVDRAAGEIEFVFSIGSNFFFEIAKFRAARLLWAQAVAAFNPGQQDSCLMRICARTSRLNKSVLDPYTNMLRATTEAFSAVLGGCQRLVVEPFGFDGRLAAGVQRVIKEEVHADAVADPAGGCYYLESLTDMLAREAWKLFQQVEAQGGYAKAVASGSIAAALAQSRAAREKAASSRRRTLVGVNNYPNTAERGIEAEAPAAESGAQFPAFRLAEPFERIRQRTVKFAAAKGRTPQVVLLKRGDVKMRMARANFAFNFFGCAGFEMVEAEDLAGKTPDLIVLCSSDPEYLALAQEICPRVSVPVVVAGNPKDQIDALKAAGVQGFIHVGSDAVETLTHWQSRLGIEG